jgi:hypothetical protein
VVNQGILHETAPRPVAYPLPQHRQLKMVVAVDSAVVVAVSVAVIKVVCLVLLRATSAVAPTTTLVTARLNP